MRTQHEVESIVQRAYSTVGGDPSQIVQIKPIDGNWENALSYEVTRSDMKNARVYRRDLDDSNLQGIERSLQQFV